MKLRYIVSPELVPSLIKSDIILSIFYKWNLKA